MSTTGQVVVDYVRQQLLEPVAGFFTDAELLAAINAAEADFFGRVRSKDGVSTFNTEDGKQIYELPDTILSIRKLFYNKQNADGTDNWKELDPISLEKLSQEHPNWLSDAEADRADPMRYMIYEDAIYLHPVPDTTGKEVRVFHKSSATPLSTLADNLNVDDTLVDAIKSHVLWKAWEKDKEAERAAVERATYLDYVGQGRRFYKKRDMGLVRRLDAQSPDPFSHNPNGGYF